MADQETGAALNPSLGRRLSLGSGVAALSERVLVGYRVHYDGRVVAGGQTTFNYTVTRLAGSGSLNHLVLQIPGCAGTMSSYQPASAAGSVGLDPATGLDGLKWGNVSISSGGSQAYSISFPGDVAEGLTRVGLKAGSDVAIGVLPGPCGGFTISGAVFDDADASGTRDAANELGVGNVTVTVVNASGETESVVTGADGRYSLRVIDGTYTVRIDYATGAADFNEQLEASFTATGPLSRSVTLGPDRPGVDFGFKPQTTKLIGDFDAGILSSTGMSAGTWTKTFRAAMRGQNTGYSAEQLLAMLNQIEGQFLAEPYVFTNGQELKEALAILTSKPRDSYGKLFKELFVAELNDAAGLGIVGNPELQDSMLAWGESLLAHAAAGARLSAGKPGDALNLDDADLDLGIIFFSRVNNSRGGGDIPES